MQPTDILTPSFKSTSGNLVPVSSPSAVKPTCLHTKNIQQLECKLFTNFLSKRKSLGKSVR
jgi:hypothetical protein